MTKRRDMVIGSIVFGAAAAARADDPRQVDRTLIRRIAAPVFPPSNQVYFPTTMTTVAGTLTQGTVADAAIRGSLIHWDEVNTTPGWDVIFDFSGVPPTPSNLYVTAWYNGNHFPILQLWNYAGSAWEQVHTYNDFASLLSVTVPIESRHYSSGALRVRFYHAQNGSATHDLDVDYVGVR